MPGVGQLHRGARSIYASYVEGDGFQLRLRWSTLESSMGYPHVLTYEGLHAINVFAAAELPAVIATGRSAQRTSRPLADTQKARQT